MNQDHTVEHQKQRYVRYDDNYLEKVGCSTYHICYDVDDIEEAVEDLFEEGFKPFFMPVESVAMDNHQICYLYNMNVGLIELVSTK